MNGEPAIVERIRAYLLGTLSNDEANALEYRYFTDPPFFRSVQEVERSLIRDFLGSRLDDRQRVLFESRYGSIPALKLVLGQVRQRDWRAGARLPVSWQVVFASTVLGGLGVAIWIYSGRHQALTQHSATAFPLQSVAAIDVLLNAGVIKGGRTNAVEVPPQTTVVRLHADLPGRLAPVGCLAKLSLIGMEGHWSEVWHSNTVIRSGPQTGAQEATFVLDSALLSNGDYILTLLTIDDRREEVYGFRVNRIEAADGMVGR